MLSGTDDILQKIRSQSQLIARQDRTQSTDTGCLQEEPSSAQGFEEGRRKAFAVHAQNLPDCSKARVDRIKLGLVIVMMGAAAFVRYVLAKRRCLAKLGTGGIRNDQV